MQADVQTEVESQSKLMLQQVGKDFKCEPLQTISKSMALSSPHPLQSLASKSHGCTNVQ